MSGTRKITIDWKLVDSLLESGNDGIRVAANLGIHADTLYRRCLEEHKTSFADYLADKRKRGESRILSKQFEMAMEGDKTMLIWVGKQMCGQKEPDRSPSDEENKKIVLEVNYKNDSENTISISSKEIPASYPTCT